MFHKNNKQVPPLPKSTGITKTERFYLEKKKKILEKFLWDVIKDPLLRNNEYFLEFLSKEQGELSEFKKPTGTNILEGENIENLQLPGGEVN